MRGRTWAEVLGGPPDVWSWCVAASIAACLARICGAAPSGVAASALLAVQLGALLIAATSSFVASRGRGASGRWPAIDLTWLVLIWGLAAASTIWSVSRAGTAQDVVGLTVVLAFLLSARVWRWEGREAVSVDVMWIYLVIAAATAVALLITLMGAGWVYGDYGRWRGLTSNANYAGMVAALAFPLGYWAAVERRGWARYVFVGSTIVLAVAIGMSGSRGASLAAVVSIVCVHVVARSGLRSSVAWCLTGLLVLSVVVGAGAMTRVLSAAQPSPSATASASGSTSGGAAVPQSPSPPAPSASSAAPVQAPALGRQDESGSDITSGRIHIWSVLLDAWAKRPLLGYGYGATASVPGADGLTAHNLALQVLVELGLVGLALFAALVLTLIRRAEWLALPALSSAVVGIGVMEMTESSILGMGGPTAVPAWVLILALSSGVLERAAQPLPTSDPVGAVDA